MVVLKACSIICTKIVGVHFVRPLILFFACMVE
nr:MAG TPA: hypothetical protein [Caudoviricetes sp.]